MGLYNRESDAFIDELTEVIERLASQDTESLICIVQKGRNSDLNQGLYSQLYHDTVFDEVYERLLKVRGFVAAVQNSPVPTLFVSTDDCKGSSFELMLACAHRICFSKKANFGFDEVRGDFFPCAGSFEKLLVERMNVANMFKLHGSIDSTKAESLALTDLTINALEQDALTSDWVKNNRKLFSPTTPRQDKSKKTDSPQQFEKLERSSIDFTKINKLRIDWSTDYCFQNRSPRALGFCETLLTNPPKSLSNTEIKSLISYASARYVLTPRFKSWFKRHLGKERTRHIVDREEVPVFSLSPYVPPAQPLLKTLHNGNRVVFYAADAQQLKNGIDLFLGRVEQQIGKENSLNLLKNQINWMQAEEDEISGCRIRFETNTQMHISENEKDYRLFHTLNSKNDTSPILAEYVCDNESQLEPRLTETLLTFCEAVYCTTSPFSNLIPVIVLARSIVFQEIIKMAVEYQDSVETILEHLKASGWRFAADSSSWERFLRTRQEFLETPKQELESFPIPIDQAIWQLGLWKECRSFVKSRKKGSQIAMSTTFASRHIMHCVVNIAHVMSRFGDNRFPKMDKLISSAIGVPHTFSNVTRYENLWGKKRLSEYIEHKWGTK